MSITDELRKYATVSWNPWPEARDRLLQMCDRIDAEHERMMRERRRSCVFYDAERNYCKVHDEGDMAELGYVRLPVDADGVPWRVGDMTENGNVVNGMTIDFHGWHFTGTRNDIDPTIHRHYVPKPTVEDVLREFAEGLGVPVADSYVAATAAKLRLAGDAE